MTDTASNFPMIREAVASFPDREHFRRAVSDLLGAGFEASDMSVLASHQPLAAADEGSGVPHEIVPAGLSDEIKYIAPLTITGIIVLSGGPIAALKELFDRYTAAPHSDDFTAALKAGAALLWVRCKDAELELAASRLLEEAGGRHVHIHGRPSHPEQREA